MNFDTEKKLVAALRAWALCVVLAATAFQVGAFGFSMPAMPDSLRVPVDRADWLMAHYWDNADFKDSQASPELEQAFVDYLTLFPIVSTDSVKTVGFEAMIALAEKGADAIDELYYLANKYLYTPESDFDNEADYILFLTSLANRGEERSQLMLQRVCMNREGETFNDFSLKVDGRNTTLSEIASESDSPLLLIIHDSGCHDCESLLAEIQRSDKVKTDVAVGKLRILALNIGDPERYPHSPVLVHAEPQSEVDVEDYVNIRRLPTLYLLNSTLTVLRKDPAPSTIF